MQSKLFEGEFLDWLEASEQDQPETAWEVADLHERLLDAILKLPKQYQQPLLLFFFEGYSYAEIIAQLGLPEGTIKSHISRGKSLLKNAINEEG